MLGDPVATDSHKLPQFPDSGQTGCLGGVQDVCKMKIRIVTPAPAYSRAGNRVTALRWARVLKGLGHTVTIEGEFVKGTCDMMVALHARRSHPSIRRFHDRFPDGPLVLALTGTDLYGDIKSDRDAQESLELATSLVVLQSGGMNELSARHRRKTKVIHQSFT